MKRLNVLVGILSFLILSFFGCFDLPEDLILPEWDIDINVPLTDKTYTIYDMYKPESKFSITSALNNDDFYLIQSDHYSTTSDVADYIQLLDNETLSQSFTIPANMPAQSLYMVFPEEIEIDQATFASGFISIAVENPSLGDINSSLRVPGIKKPDGSELIFELNVAALSTDSIIYNLSNHEYILPASQPMENKNSLQLLAAANSPLNGSFENVTMYMSNFKFSSITGSLPRTSLGIKKTSATLSLNDVADFRGKIFIEEGYMSLKAQYVAGYENIFELEISDVKINGIRNNGEVQALARTDGKAISYNLVNGFYELTLDESNSNLTEFISFMPDSVVISSEYILNPLNNKLVRRVTNQDSIKFSLQFATRSVFALKESNFIDTVDIDLSQDDREKIRDAMGADLNVYLENAIPIDAFVRATLTDENYIPLLTLTRNPSGVDSLLFSGSQVNTSTGEIISPTITLNKIELDSAQIVNLSNSFHLIISTTVNTKNAANDNPNPPKVQLKSSDWLNIKCFGKVKMHVNGEDN